MPRRGSAVDAAKQSRPDPQYEQLVFQIKARRKALFEMLADQWERETRNLSSPNSAVRHPAYQRIIDMGRLAVPWVLRRLAEYPGFWFKALSEMTQERNDPVRPEMYGDVLAMRDAWLRWGEKHGIRVAEDRNT
jgi:hypothetical protein